MIRFGSSRYIFGSCAAAALLAGCGVLPLSSSKGQDDTMPIVAPGARPQGPALAARGGSSNYKVLYRFLGEPDGAFPFASLTGIHGTLYGTTRNGGSTRAGTVFSMTTGGTEKTLYSFKKPPDGAEPVASLIAVKGTLYGTTISGGHQRDGTAFSMTTGGVEHVLYRFGFGADRLYGTHPAAALIAVGGAFYGTTEKGGAYRCYRYNSGCGTLFGFTLSGGKILHSFGHYQNSDGMLPRAGLIDVDGTLYGTTYSDFGLSRGTSLASRRAAALMNCSIALVAWAAGPMALIRLQD
ncbi:MAG TPA: choice-of-anchor tandem repeat GloVer-containing protein [Candidatus Cybelea sp.]|jgi:uncharacterized repeat protein (TIGR03803 family)